MVRIDSQDQEGWENTDEREKLGNSWHARLSRIITTEKTRRKRERLNISEIGGGLESRDCLGAGGPLIKSAPLLLREESSYALTAPSIPTRVHLRVTSEAFLQEGRGAIRTSKSGHLLAGFSSHRARFPYDRYRWNGAIVKWVNLFHPCWPPSIDYDLELCDLRTLNPPAVQHPAGRNFPRCVYTCPIFCRTYRGARGTICAILLV